jgi:hypothetical protein
LGQLVKEVGNKISRRLGYVPHASDGVVAQTASGVLQEGPRR